TATSRCRCILMITSELFWYVPLTAFSGSFIVQLKLRPPSTINVCPVTKSPPVIKPRIAPATSSALAMRWSGKPAEALAMAWGYSVPKCSLIHGVSVNAGATQFQRTRGASAAASPLVRYMSAAFAVPYGRDDRVGGANTPEIDETFTIIP